MTVLELLAASLAWDGSTSRCVCAWINPVVRWVDGFIRTSGFAGCLAVVAAYIAYRGASQSRAAEDRRAEELRESEEERSREARWWEQARWAADLVVDGLRPASSPEQLDAPDRFHQLKRGLSRRLGVQDPEIIEDEAVQDDPALLVGIRALVHLSDQQQDFEATEFALGVLAQFWPPIDTNP